jgi:hypothetical protein
MGPDTSPHATLAVSIWPPNLNLTVETPWTLTCVSTQPKFGQSTQL